MNNYWKAQKDTESLIFGLSGLSNQYIPVLFTGANGHKNVLPWSQYTIGSL